MPETPEDLPIRRALISVSDKAGLVDFAQGLAYSTGTGNIAQQLAELRGQGQQQVADLVSSLQAIPSNDLVVNSVQNLESLVSQIANRLTSLDGLTGQVTVNPTFNNTFSNTEQASLLEQIRRQTLNDITDIVAGAVS